MGWKFLRFALGFGVHHLKLKWIRSQPVNCHAVVVQYYLIVELDFCGRYIKLSLFILLDSPLSSNDKHWDSRVLPSNTG